MHITALKLEGKSDTLRVNSGWHRMAQHMFYMNSEVDRLRTKRILPRALRIHESQEQFDKGLIIENPEFFGEEDMKLSPRFTNSNFIEPCIMIT